jgi:myo-inositol-hexaphosphate 3-phosphohydrolase
MHGAWETFELIDQGNGYYALQAANGQFVCAEGGGGREVVANRDAIGAWETFKLIDRGNGNVALQAANGQYVCAEGGGGGAVVANRMP